MNTKESVINNFKNLNDYLEEKNLHISLIVMGGAWFLLNEISERETHDIDVVVYKDEKYMTFSDLSPTAKKDIYAYDINSAVEAFGISRILQFDDKPKNMNLGFSNLEVLLPSPELILLTKLKASQDRGSDKSRKKYDEDDIAVLMTKYRGKLNAKRMSRIIDDFFSIAVNKEIQEFEPYYIQFLEAYSGKGFFEDEE